ncbi:MAG: HAD family hydrolase [Deltaproteobacteria bacterium]
MAPRAVLFDKDGTLIDFFAMWVPAYEEAAQRVVERMERPELLDAILRSGGYDPTTKQVTPGSVLASGTNQEVVDAWAAAAGDAWDDALGAVVHETFHAHALRPPKPTADLFAVFSALRERGVAVGVATMDAHASAEAALTQLGVRALVDVVLGSDDVQHPKPAPDMVLDFARAVKVDPAEVVMVGDSPIDLMMGRAAGVAATVGVLTGPSGHADLAPHADHVVASVAAFTEGAFFWQTT